MDSFAPGDEDGDVARRKRRYGSVARRSSTSTPQYILIRTPTAGNRNASPKVWLSVNRSKPVSPPVWV